MAKETETGPEVWGCTSCGMVFNFSAYSHPYGSPLVVCPCCGVDSEDHLRVLGPIPCMIVIRKKFYLADDTGDRLGPYDTVNDLHHDLWAWFTMKKHKGDRDGRQEEDYREEEGSEEEEYDKIVQLWKRE